MRFNEVEKIDVFFRPNTLGFKDYEHSLLRTKPTFRVLLLGDSYVQGTAILPEEQTGRVMERIAESKGINLEVISMGMSGYGQTHHIVNYKTIGRQFKPDLVITLFCSNDIWNNALVSPHHSLENGQLISIDPVIPTIGRFKKFLRTTFQKTETYFVLRSMTVKAIQLVSQSILNSDVEQKAAAVKAATAKIPSPKESHSETKDEYLERIIGAKDHRELFVALVKELENLIVKDQKTPLLHAIVSSRISKDIEPDYLNFLNWVENTLTKNGGGRPVINFHKIFTNLYSEHGSRVHFASDVHWSPLGHQLVAQNFMDYILENFNMSSYRTED